MIGNERQMLLAQIENAKKEQSFMANRMTSKDKWLRAMGVYYAVFAAVAAALSLIYTQQNFSQFSAVLTVLLSMLVMVLCTQRYSRQARHHHTNAHAMEQLMYESAEETEYRVLREKYAVLSGAVEEISSHEKRAILRMHDIENKRRVFRGEEVLRAHYLCGYEKFKYWLVEIVRIILRVLIFAAPAAVMVLTAAGLI